MLQGPSTTETCYSCLQHVSRLWTPNKGPRSKTSIIHGPVLRFPSNIVSTKPSPLFSSHVQTCSSQLHCHARPNNKCQQKDMMKQDEAPDCKVSRFQRTNTEQKVYRTAGKMSVDSVHNQLNDCKIRKQEQTPYSCVFGLPSSLGRSTPCPRRC